MAIVRAPWTADQVSSLNAYQVSAELHPFTCLHQGDGGHVEGHYRDKLLATAVGWICSACLYRQDWAHDFMLDQSWRNPTAEMIAAILGTAKAATMEGTEVAGD